MTTTKTLLIADDLSDRSKKGRMRSKTVRANAFEIAAKMSLDVELLYVHDMNPHLFKKGQKRYFLEEFDTIKSSIEDQISKMNLKGRVKVKTGIASDEILQEINLIKNPEILVLSTQGNTGLKKLLLGSVAEEVIRNSPIPVLAIGPLAQEKQAVVKIDKNLQIVFLTDFDEASNAAEDLVLRICQEQGCSVVIFHSVGEQIMRLRNIFYSSSQMQLNPEPIFADMTEEAQRTLTRKTESWVRKGINAKSVLIVKEDPLEKHLKKILKPQIGLIVMGTHGRNRVMSSLIGSNTRRVLLESPVPVLIANNKGSAQGAKTLLKS